MTTWSLDFSFTAMPHDFKLQIAANWQARVTGIFGPSGSGKSTLLEVLLGIRPRSGLKGTARLDERVLFKGGGTWLPPAERRIAWVPQDACLFPHLTAKGNLMLAAKNPLLSTDKVIEMLELGSLLDRRPHQLSGGERQRVALGRALLTRHDSLLLDEPLSALDRDRRQSLVSYIKRIVDELPISVLYVSHDWDEILALCEHVLLLDGGRLVSSGPPSHGRLS